MGFNILLHVLCWKANDGAYEWGERGGSHADCRDVILLEKLHYPPMRTEEPLSS